MRLLGAVRLSDLTEETTSPARQREAITHTAIARGDTLTETIEDLDVSGAVSPFDRNGLGPWLSQPSKIKQWDGLIVHKLDRLTRSLDDFAKLVKWCNANGKTIISISESLDLSTSHGRMLANILITFAEFERERISERRKEAAVKLRQDGRWGGGRIPYGYKPHYNGSGWELVPDPDTSKVVERMARDVISGISANELARRLMTEQVPSPQGKGWHSTGIIRILRNPALRGYVTTAKTHEQPQIVRDSEGMPVKRDPILDDVTWTRLQRALDAASQQKSGIRQDGHPLLGVAICGVCKGSLHAFRFTKNGRKYAYYRCANRAKRTCSAPQIRMEDLETQINDAFIRDFGSKPMLERYETEGDDHSRELAEIGQQIADLTAERFVQQVIRPDYDKMMSTLQTEHARISALPAEGARVEWIDMDRTLGAEWDSLENMTERGRLLAKMGFKALFHREEGVNVLQWIAPDEQTVIEVMAGAA